VRNARIACTKETYAENCASKHIPGTTVNTAAYVKTVSNGVRNSRKKPAKLCQSRLMFAMAARRFAPAH
jgi:hypothetical protein